MSTLAVLSSRAVDQRLNLGGAAVVQALREIPGNDNPHFGVAVVKRSGECGIIVHHPHNVEVLAGLKALQQILALLAAVAVVDVNGQALEIEIDTVTE